MMNGAKQYKAIVTKAGKPLGSTVYSDWFAGDEQAEAGYREILEAQGYRVKAVETGETWKVEIE